MKVLIRADASAEIGAGHIMRCLSLAAALKASTVDCECIFATRALPGNLDSHIKSLGFEVLSLPDLPFSCCEAIEAESLIEGIDGEFDLLIVDHYQLGQTFTAEMRNVCSKVMVIDDLANRHQDCDLLLDQNLVRNMETRYQGLLPAHVTSLLGPSYALLRPEFYRSYAPVEGQYILVCFGGGDADNLSAMALEAIIDAKPKNYNIDVVIGSSNPWQKNIESICQMLNQKLSSINTQARTHVHCDYIAKLMSRAQLMIGAGGGMHWERCKMNLPALTVTLADNQRETTANLAKLGTCVWLGDAGDMSVDILSTKLKDLLERPQLIKEMASNCQQIVGESGGIPKVVKAIKNLMWNE